jgi:hypothetical protein
MDQAVFKSGRVSSAFLGLGLLALVGCIGWMVLFMDEDRFLGSHTRRGGIIKLIEASIGWPAFVVLMLLFGGWLTVYAAVSLWKALDGTADVTAMPDALHFHPAVRGSPASYDELSHWRIEMVSGHPVLWLHFHQAYWSLQGLVKRKTVKLEGGQEDLEPLVNYFSRHPVMNGKFVG